MIDPQRTDQQNKALYLYFEMLSKALNDAGLDMRVVLKPEVEIPWTKISVKEHLWRPIQKIMLDKESTTEANTSDYNKIYEVLHRHMAQKHGITVLWPHHSMQGFEEHWSNNAD